MNTNQNPATENDLKEIDQIQALKSQFFYFDDDEDINGIISLFTEDAVVNVGTGELVGKKAIREFFEGSYAATSMTRHMVTNPLIKVNGNNAMGKWYMLAFVTYATEPEKLLMGQGTWEDTFKKVNGEWKINVTRYHMNFMIPYAKI